MKLWGTVWPDGESDEYTGYYLRKSDIEKCVQNNELVGKPVKVEHRGDPIGNVVSVWKHNDRMDCVLDVNEALLEGAIAKRFIETGTCPDLSIQYRINMKNSIDGKSEESNKDYVEVSIVRQGARANCKIWHYEGKT